MSDELLAQLVSRALGREILPANAAWRSAARSQLLRAVLDELRNEPAAGAATEESPVASRAAEALHELYRERARQLRVSPDAYKSTASPAEALQLLVSQHEAQLASGKVDLSWLPHELRVIEYLTDNDLQRSVALQRVWLKLLALEMRREGSDQAARGGCALARTRKPRSAFDRPALATARRRSHHAQYVDAQRSEESVTTMSSTTHSTPLYFRTTLRRRSCLGATGHRCRRHDDAAAPLSSYSQADSAVLKNARAAWLFAALVVIGILLPASTASAVVVFKRGEDKPVMGFLIRQDENQVVVRRPLADGRFRDHVFLRSEIADLILTIDEERLAALSQDRPKAYRDYADELAAKRQDPEARYTAIRLYLIAAHLDQKREGRSAMLGMIALARSEAEESRFRAMAYLLDEDHDRSLLKSPQLSVDSPLSLDAAAKQKLLAALRLAREGDKTKARTLLTDPSVRKQIEQFEDVIAYADLLNDVNAGDLPHSMLRKVVSLELALSAGGVSSGSDQPARKRQEVSWQLALRRDGSAPFPVLTLESLTEFDPRECHYREGKWIDPNK